MPLSVRQSSDQDMARWDQYALDSPSSTPFHLSAWRRVIVESYGHRPYYLSAEQEGKTHGILPLFEIRSPFSGRYLASCPFTSFGGVCADSPEAAAALLAAAEDLAVERNARYVEIKNTAGAIAPPDDWQTKTSYCTMRMDLDAGAQAIWDGWPTKNRTNVRRATKGGVTIESGPHLLDEFYDVLARNMTILGTPVHSRRFYGLMLDQYASDASLYVARVEGRTIAASLGVAINDRLEILSGASLPQFRNLKATSLLYWTIIEAACARGLKMLDLGRSMYDSGTYDFKAQLGCKALGLEYIYYLNRAPAVPDVSPENPSYRLAITTWQRLPLAVTKWIGPRLIRYIA